MASTEKIEQTAKELGEMIAAHQATKEYDAAESAVADDLQTQRLINDFNRHLQNLAEKQQGGQAIEVEDKRKLEQLQQQLAQNTQVRRLQLAQMNYLDLLRKVMSTIAETASPEGSSPVEQTPGPEAVAGQIRPQ